jgi:hypothetical protein
MAQARPMTGAELDAFAAALEVLAAAFQDYRARTGGEAILVGGGAVIVHIGGAFFSGDFDIVAGDSAVMAACMAEQGFVAEDRPGRLRVGWYHPDHPLFGFQQVRGPLFDGRAAPEMAVEVVLRDGLSITVPAVEDLIADRLAQHAIASLTDQSRLLQAIAMFRMAPEVDWPYLERRSREEGGDPALLLHPPAIPSAPNEEEPDDAPNDPPS